MNNRVNGDIFDFWIERLKIIKISILFIVICIFNTILVEIPKDYW